MLEWFDAFDQIYYTAAGKLKCTSGTRNILFIDIFTGVTVSHVLYHGFMRKSTMYDGKLIEANLKKNWNLKPNVGE